MTKKIEGNRIYLKPLPITLCYSAFGFLGLFLVYTWEYFMSKPSPFGIVPRDPLVTGMEWFVIAVSIGMFLFSYFYVYRNELKSERFWEAHK